MAFPLCLISDAWWEEFKLEVMAVRLDQTLEEPACGFSCDADFLSEHLTFITMT